MSLIHILGSRILYHNKAAMSMSTFNRPAIAITAVMIQGVIIFHKTLTVPQLMTCATIFISSMTNTAMSLNQSSVNLTN